LLYEAYELQRKWMESASAMAGLGAQWMHNPVNPLSHTEIGTMMASGLDVFRHASAPHGKPRFDYGMTVINGKAVPVVEKIEAAKPFGRLIHFVREGAPAGQPRLLIVAPMSGHYATLLRGTVERMLPAHDVWITDWEDARLVPLEEGRFDLDDYIDYLTGFLEHIGRRPHVLAVCQPAVPAFAAACLMSAADHPNRPRTLTMMGGPIDTREAPTAVNTTATQRPFSWFEQNVIATVPWTYPGAGRKVYPGFLQLSGFMAMNWGNHMVSHWQMFRHLVDGDDQSAQATMAFYDEYRSVCDMTAEFYLQTIDVVFQSHALPDGKFVHRGERVDPASITDIAILAIEGERDDISGIGQTKAALKITTNLPESRKQYLLAEKVGHYGIFNGRRWREQIAPVLDAFIAKAEGEATPSGEAPHKTPEIPKEERDSANFA
jgi:poly(3-hydroxybutyrate) depolymerase